MTKEEILAKNCHTEKHPQDENMTVVYSHINSVLTAMQEYATQEKQGWRDIEQDRSFWDLEDFLVLFDSGDIRRYDETNHPMAVMTHWMPLPQKPEV